MAPPSTDERWFILPMQSRPEESRRTVLAGKPIGANRLVKVFDTPEEAEAAVREHNDRLQKNGPAEAATSPSLGSNNPYQENAVNKQHRTTAPVVPATRTYRAAFERLEAPISNILLASKTQRALLDGIFPGCEAQHVTAVQNEAICHVANLIFGAAEELDDLWLDAHNEEGAPVTSATQREHRVHLHSREGEKDSLVSITDAAHATRDLVYGLMAINTEVPNKQLVDALWTGVNVVHGAMNDLVARLEAELEARRSAQ